MSRMASRRFSHCATCTSIAAIVKYELFIYVPQAQVFRSVYTSLLTKQNDLAVFDYSTRKTCTDTYNAKRVGRPE